MISVLVVDDHDIVREGIKQIVSETADIAVRGEARSGAAALDALRSGTWNVVILDLNLPDRPGLDVLGQIRSIAPQVPVLILSMHSQGSYATRALRAGASGYVSKDSARTHLVAAIRKVVKGERFIAPDMAESMALDLMDSSGKRRHELLSDREFEVLCMIASGKPPRQMAADLSVSVKTIATHRSRLLEKMGLKNNAEVVQYAIEHGLLRG